VVSFPPVSPSRPYTPPSPHPYAPYAQPISLYLLTPWCRVLLEKLTGLQPVKKFPAFHVTRRFITALTSVRHLSLSWANPMQSIYPHPTSCRSILILSTHLRLGFRNSKPKLTISHPTHCSLCNTPAMSGALDYQPFKMKRKSSCDAHKLLFCSAEDRPKWQLPFSTHLIHSPTLTVAYQ